MSMEIFRDVALLALFVALAGILLATVTPRGATGFEEAVRVPIAKKPFGQGEEGR